MPALWQDRYVAWDQTIGAGQVLQASYKLSAPDWSKIPGVSPELAAYLAEAEAQARAAAESP